MSDVEGRVYRTVIGRPLDLSALTAKERRLIRSVLWHYGRNPEWSKFGAWWMGQLARTGLDEDSVVYQVCDDLEARLGIVQGKVSPPDYREYLAALIEERFGTRYRFCKEAKVDQGQLSRVLAGHAELSLQLLHRILKALNARLAVHSNEALDIDFSPEEARRTLASAVS